MNNVIAGSVNEAFSCFCDSIAQLNEQDKAKLNLDSYFHDTTTISNEYANNNAFVKENTMTFPEPLASIIHNPLSIPYKLGFLLNANRVWLTANKTLYIWNFLETDNIFRYDCHDSIERVEICERQKELYVCTRNSLFVHSFSIDTDSRLKILSKTNARTSGVVMSNILNTDTGRTFMQGDDGHLYELNIDRDSNGLAVGIKKFSCITEQSYFRYLSLFVNSVPEVPIKKIALNNEEKILYILLKDSTIQAVDIQGNNFVYGHKFKATMVEDIQLVPTSESRIIDLIAIDGKGNRYYLSNKAGGIGIVHERLAPPILGSLLFNQFTNETLQHSFYDSGVFAAIVSKSSDNYLLLTRTALTRVVQAQPVYNEDFYAEKLNDTLMIMESELNTPGRYIENIIEASGKPQRQILTLNKNGVTFYKEQRLIEQFSTLLTKGNPSAIIEFIEKYGVDEALALCLLISIISPAHNREAMSLLYDHPSVDNGLLLYISRLLKDIRTVDILAEDVPLDAFNFVADQLEKLHSFLQQAKINISNDLRTYTIRCKEGVRLVQFIHEVCLRSEATRKKLVDYAPLIFEKLVSTEKGAFAAKNVVVACIELFEISDSSRSQLTLTPYLFENCRCLLGESNIGLESLRHAEIELNKEPELEQSLTHFKKIVELISLDQLKELCNKYCALKGNIESMKLVLAKYQLVNTEQKTQIYELIYDTLRSTFDEPEERLRVILQESLDLLDEEAYHEIIYQWLIDKKQERVLVTLTTPHLVQFFTTKLPESVGYHYLFEYYTYRSEYYDAIVALRRLSTVTRNVDLDKRVYYLERACDLMGKSTGISNNEKQELLALYKEATIQTKIRNALQQRHASDSTSLVQSLNDFLKPAKELYHNIALPQNLYEEALYLMDFMELYDWKYAQLAWERIVKENKDSNALKNKLITMGKDLYPSIASYPVFMLVHILDAHCQTYPEEFKDEFVISTLTEVGVPQEIISEARTAKV
ncbi:uncharacterized protein RHIMIDRAFT_232630 [Rhizopus microsporus ATCC 52813]|uniref:Uncharacterized protein n=1 Tax=Rhizopus microsporus ATCC 52813 TaxID=1340429 RepID=A0A2G4T856_RHIZD|nr:uncharacterized protein RHIMIDRAFT_232630 [Rhizopus microsporus ATCC 52813]PHZ17198.1 hypothetical protein RHIMIDRAFT_232630 [Rhizopus microsporus ATCC 52813]